MIGLSLGAAKPNALRQPNRSAQEVILVTAAEGKLASATGNRILTITLAAPHPLAGSYRIKVESLAEGPLCLVPPTIIGDGSGKALSVQPGLWACDPALGAPEFTLSWMAGEVILAGEADSTLALTQDLGGQAVRHAETLCQGTLKGVSISAPVQITGIQPEPEPRLAVIPEPNATLTATVQDGEVTISVTASPKLAGSYTVQTVDFAAGPINHVAPTITGQTAMNAVYTAAPGFWTHDADAAPLTVHRRWQRDGVDISGATATTYTTSASDGGKAIRWAETATDARGSRTVHSNVLQFAADAKPTDTFTVSSNRSLIDYVGESGESWVNGTAGSTAVGYVPVSGVVAATGDGQTFIRGAAQRNGDQFAEATLIKGSFTSRYFRGSAPAVMIVGRACYYAGYYPEDNAFVLGYQNASGAQSILASIANTLPSFAATGNRVTARIERRTGGALKATFDTLELTANHTALTGGGIGIAGLQNATHGSGTTLDNFNGGNL